MRTTILLPFLLLTTTACDMDNSVSDHTEDIGHELKDGKIGAAFDEAGEGLEDAAKGGVNDPVLPPDHPLRQLDDQLDELDRELERKVDQAGEWTEDLKVRQSEVDKARDKLEDAVDKAGDELDQAAQDIKESIEEIGRRLKGEG